MFNSALMDLFNPRIALKIAEFEDDQFLLCHTGHGMNSYHLSLIVSRGPLVAFVQHGWGNVYGNSILEMEHIVALYARLHVLFEKIEGRPGPSSLLIQMPDIDRGRPSLTELNQDHPSIGGAIRLFDGESELFAAADERLEIEGPAEGGSARW